MTMYILFIYIYKYFLDSNNNNSYLLFYDSISITEFKSVRFNTRNLNALIKFKLKEFLIILQPSLV